MNKEVIKEIDTLIAFWLTHDCNECTDELRKRMPSQEFPNIYKFLRERHK